MRVYAKTALAGALDGDAAKRGNFSSIMRADHLRL